MLIGRKEELKTLHQALIADESKFVAIYGRRRVGKTFLVREAFKHQRSGDRAFHRAAHFFPGDRRPGVKNGFRRHARHHVNRLIKTQSAFLK